MQRNHHCNGRRKTLQPHADRESTASSQNVRNDSTRLGGAALLRPRFYRRSAHRCAHRAPICREGATRVVLRKGRLSLSSCRSSTTCCRRRAGRSRWPSRSCRNRRAIKSASPTCCSGSPTPSRMLSSGRASGGWRPSVGSSSCSTRTRRPRRWAGRRLPARAAHRARGIPGAAGAGCRSCCANFGALPPCRRGWPSAGTSSRSIDGMKLFVRRSDERNRLALSTLDDLRDYCYSVAGIVGEMLTELYLFDRAELASFRGRAPQPCRRLRRRAAVGEHPEGCSARCSGRARLHPPLTSTSTRC